MPSVLEFLVVEAKKENFLFSNSVFVQAKKECLSILEFCDFSGQERVPFYFRIL